MKAALFIELMKAALFIELMKAARAGAASIELMKEVGRWVAW